MYNSKKYEDIVTGIYCFTNKTNGKQYVGLSKDIALRYANHIGARSPKKSAMFLPIKKYGIEAFTFEVLEECSEADLCEREIYWIEKLDSYNTGYNKTTGGEGTSGHQHSAETKAKIAAAKKGKKASAEAKAKMAAAKKGKKASAETKAKVSASKMKKVSVTAPQPDGTVLLFDSMQAAAEALNINLSTVQAWCSGRQKQPGQGNKTKTALQWAGWTFHYSY